MTLCLVFNVKGYSEGKRLKYYQANWGQFVISRNTIFLCTFYKRPTANCK